MLLLVVDKIMISVAWSHQLCEIHILVVENLHTSIFTSLGIYIYFTKPTLMMEKGSLPNCKADKEKWKTCNLAILDINDSLAGRPSASWQIGPDTGRKEINENKDESGNHESNICSKVTENTFMDSQYLSTQARLVQRRHTLPRNPLLHESADNNHDMDLGYNRTSLPATLCNSVARRASFDHGTRCGSCGWLLLKVLVIFCLIVNSSSWEVPIIIFLHKIFVNTVNFHFLL